MAVGYRTALTQAVMEALRNTFPEGGAAWEDYRLDGINIGIEYPMERVKYPYIMVSFTEKTLHSSSLSGANPGDSVVDVDGTDMISHRKLWKFTGTVDLDIFALSAFERDLMADGLVAAIGFGTTFRDELLSNEYIYIEMNTQVFEPGPMVSSPGTPWDSDEVVYTMGYTFDTVGTFVSDGTNLSIISAVNVYPRKTGDPDIPDNTQGEWV